MTQSQLAPDVGNLVRNAQAGDEGARDELLSSHLPLIYNIIGRALDGHPDVDDLVQETMLRALRGLPTLREPDRFRSWLVSIAYRQIQLHIRACQMARKRRLPELVEVPVGDFADRTAAELVVADQRQELVEAARWLDDTDRRLLGLWWQEAAGELTRAELAAALDVRPKHAAVRVQRMKAQLDAARGVVRALRAKPRCAELSVMLRRWDGAADPLWRKRLVRHVRDCPQCALRQDGLVAPEELLLGMAALPIPVGLAHGLASGLSTAALPAHAASTSLLPAFVHHKALAATSAAAVIAVGGGLAYTAYQTPWTGPNAAIAPPAAVRPSAPGVVIRTRAPSSTASATPTARPAGGVGVLRADLYVSSNGSDSDDGSITRPYATLAKAVATVQPGQTIALRGGTYRPTAGLTISTSGTAAKRIVLTGYRGERPIIDAAGIPAGQWAVTQQAAFWTIQGLEVKNAKSHAYVCRACHDNVFRRLSMHDNAGAGLMLRDAGTTQNQVLDSDFFNNNGKAGGLCVQLGVGDGNTLRGNRAFGNAAAGFDLGDFRSPLTLEYNWSFRNGANGFVLNGGAAAAHSLRHNAAWDNGGHGFTDDGGSVGAAIVIGNNTAYRNHGTGFALTNPAAILRYNVAVDNGAAFALPAEASQNRNSWQEAGWSAAKFRTTNPATAEAPRPADGGLPSTVFLNTGNGVGASMSGG
ncbi:MAG TPA: sigma-70 family RNA polymerase sigma factor [Actinoplanes sp.]